MLNRAGIFAELARLTADAGPSCPLAVLLVRIRRLREVNLLHGYAAGEAYVDAIERRIRGVLRDQDRLWRVADADFIALLPRLRERNHAALAAAKVVRSLQTPLPCGDHVLLPVATVGMSIAPEDAVDPEDLCRFADLACDDAWSQSERHAFYRTPPLASRFTHGELRDAIAGNRLQLFLQPIADLRSGRIDRCEALSRWNHPRLGPVPPDVFVRVAEQSGLAGELTRWSMNVALRHLAEAQRAAGSEGAALVPSVSVNVAVDALQQPGFAHQVMDLLRLWGVEPDRLVLEVTEGGLMREPQECERLLAQLRQFGVGIAIDDFGTGYSSMAYLRRLPATELKIDKSFVRDMAADPRARKLVASMIDVSHHLDMAVVAEGVEDASSLALLRSMGCDHAQGYHVGLPRPAQQMMASLAGGGRN